MSVMVRLQVEFYDLETLLERLREQFPQVETLAGLEDPLRRWGAIEKALAGQGLEVRQYRDSFSTGVARARAGSPGVSRYGDLGVLAEGTPDRPVYRLVYDAHGTDLGKIQAVVQGYIEAVVRQEAARRGYLLQERWDQEDGTRVLVFQVGGGGR